MTTTYNVASEGATFGNTDITTLNGAIRAIDTGAADNYVINLTGDITLSSQLLAINLPAGSTLTINGNSHTIDGDNGTYNGLFVYSGNVTIESLTLQNMAARGGGGGNDGGAGAGLGGGLFIAGSNGSGGHDPSQAVIPDVTLDNVIFSNDAAIGGTGGGSEAVGAGGGLDGGHGGNGPSVAGGGGIGLSATGGNSSGSGGAGIIPGAPSGGGSKGGASGGGGGGGNAGGGISGFGGGGGGTAGGGGGNGGFGGGGGGGVGLGAGGYGGGGGGGFSGSGVGGFGGGNGKNGDGGGGGGLGAGGDIFVQQGGTLTINGGSLSGGSVTAGIGQNGGGNGRAFGSGIFLQGNGTLTLTPASAQADVIADVITDQTANGGTGNNAGSWGLVLNGAGTLVLGAADTYSGGTTISAGTLQLGNGGTTGSIVGGLSSDNGIFAIDHSDTVTWGTVISGTGAFEQLGTGTTIFTAAESYAGQTLVDAGTLQLGSGGSLVSGGNLTINGGTFDLNGHSQTIGDLSGTGGILTLGAGTLIAGLADSTTFAGAISGSGVFVKDGTATLTLTGASSNSGGTVIDTGTLQIGNGGGLGSLSGDVLDEATLAIDRSGIVTLSGSISGGGSLDQIGSGTVVITANDSYSGGTTISAGALQLGDGGADGAIAGTVANDATFAIDRSDTFVFGGAISGIGSFEQIGTGTTVFNTNQSYQGGTTISAGTLQLGDGGTSGLIALSPIVDDGTLAIDHSDSVTWSDVISGNGAFVQLGSGTVTFSGDNQFHGGVTIDAGTFELANANAAGTGVITFSANADATLKIDLGDVPGNTIKGFAAGDTLDLASVTLDPNGGAKLLANNVLEVSEDGNTYDLQLDPNASFAGEYFHVAADSSGTGSAITEMATPILTVDHDSTTPIGAAGAGDVAFTLGGLASGDAGSVTFTDGNGKTVVVDVSGRQTRYSANLSSLADGTISSSLTITANTLVAIAGNSVTLDQNLADQAANILWRNSSGALTTWLLNGSTLESSAVPAFDGFAVSPDPSWTVAGRDDFNGDGDADILWRQSSTGSLAEWFMNGGTIQASAPPIFNGSVVSPDSSWSVAGLGDFNGDGDADILWRQSSTGSLAEWFMNGGTIQASAPPIFNGGVVSPDSSWSVAGLGDFNGDGDADILWRQSSTGSLVDWNMSGSTISSSASLTYQGNIVTPDSSWSIVGVGDFNGDGNADIVWRQNSTGSLAIWLMKGSTVESSAAITFGNNRVAPDSTWNVVQVGDFASSADSSVLWQQSSTGLLVEWQMNGSQIVSSQTITSGGNPVAPPSGWQVQARPTDFA